MPRCIFCRTPTSGEPEEHIVPESLVGDVPFRVSAQDGTVVHERRLVLNASEVCARCNHKHLAPLDSYLQKQLGLVKVLLNPNLTKRGRPATAERPGLYGERRGDGPYFVFNAEKHPIVASDGRTVPPSASSSDGVTYKDFRVDGDRVSLTVSQPVRMNKRFVRALHKIAFELLALQKGADYVLTDRFNPIRDYVLKATGTRVIALTDSGSHDSLQQPFLSLEKIIDNGEWVAHIGLGAQFFIDLSPGNVFFDRVAPAALRAAGFVLWSDKAGGQALN